MHDGTHAGPSDVVGDKDFDEETDREYGESSVSSVGGRFQCIWQSAKDGITVCLPRRYRRVKAITFTRQCEPAGSQGDNSGLGVPTGYSEVLATVTGGLGTSAAQVAG